MRKEPTAEVHLTHHAEAMEALSQNGLSLRYSGLCCRKCSSTGSRQKTFSEVPWRATVTDCVPFLKKKKDATTARSDSVDCGKGSRPKMSSEVPRRAVNSRDQ